MDHEMLEYESRRSWYCAMFPRLLHKGMPYLEFSPGWDDIVIRLLQGIDAVLTDGQATAFEVRQVKEKFGTLRFYYGFSDFTKADSEIDALASGNQESVREQIRILVEEAIAATERTCEMCGSPARLREGRPWLRVLCRRCDLRSSR